MKAVILAAGIGRRLRELTSLKPKCLVHLNGRSIIDYQLDALLQQDLEEIILVVGFRAGQLIAHVEKRYPREERIRFVLSPDYETTNNMYSLWQTRDLFTGRAEGCDMLLMNADVVFDESILGDLMQGSGNALCVDIGSYAAESMKVASRNGNASIGAISKAIEPDDALGCSIDLYRFDPSGVAALFEECRCIIEEEGQLNEWTEVALDRLLRRQAIDMQTIDVGGRPWSEIDNMQDLRAAESLFGRSQVDWHEVDLAFVDLDGTLYRGGADVPGGDRFVARLKDKVRWLYFLSNNSSRSHAQYCERLGRAGIEVQPGEIVLSSDALISFLINRGISSVYVVGTTAFEELLAKAGIHNSPDSPEAVVLGYDTELTYAKLKRAALLLQNSSMPYFATHTDAVCPTEAGSIPDIGAMIALVETATGRRPDATFGKPQREMVRHLFARHAVSSERSIFFGDRVDTDYKMARACGGRFVGVLTGDASRGDFETCEDLLIFPSVAEVFPE